MFGVESLFIIPMCISVIVAAVFATIANARQATYYKFMHKECEKKMYDEMYAKKYNGPDKGIS